MHYHSKTWQEINMEQHLWHFRSKISPNRLMSFPVVLTPYLDVISYLHPPMYSHHCPFTIPSLDRESFPIKHDESCGTNPPACLNLEGQSFFTCTSNTCHFKVASQQGQLVPHLRLSQEGVSTTAPLLGVPEPKGWKYKDNAVGCWCWIVSSEFKVRKKWKGKRKNVMTVIRRYVFPSWNKEVFTSLQDRIVVSAFITLLFLLFKLK